ncbi:MAG: hypothetical protein DIU68_005605 [Chloroflexota bacterium]
MEGLITSPADTALHPAPNFHPRIWGRLWPLLLLLVLLVGVWLLLLARGLDLGFTGDLLDYAYHYERLGVSGGMQWLLTKHLQRHLFAGLFPAPLAYFFPRESAVWYAMAFAVHYAAAVMSFMLADAVLKGKLRWVSFSAALIFAFHTLHLRMNFEFPTIYMGTAALFLALLSLWLYLQYVRRGRCNRWWIECSIAAYSFAVGLYEQTVLFFALHPIIAFFESRYRGEQVTLGRFLKRALADSFWFPVFVVVYLYLLRALFIGNGTLSFNPAYIAGQVAAGLMAEFAPVPFLERLLAGLIAAVALAILLVWWINHELRALTHKEGDAFGGSSLVYLVVLGGGISIVSIVGVAPTSWPPLENPRMIYPSAVGFGFVVAGLLGLLHVQPLGRLFAAMTIAVLVAAGFSGLLSIQSEYIRQQAARQAVLNAIQSVISQVSTDPLPYLLLVSDAHPSNDLWLYAQDNRFPYTFDLMYDVTGMPVDALYMDVDPADAPPPDVPGSRYQGKFIVVEEEGIYSPLRPAEPIDPSRLVIIEYDSTSQTARILDELPEDVLARANIVERVPIEWKTNHSLVIPVDN